jgi:beta-glucosidase
VVSDCGGPENFVHKQSVATNLEEARRLAILAGADIECGSSFKKALVSAVEKGLLRESDLDSNVRRVLRTKFKLGLFENPGRQNMVWEKLPEYDTPEHRALAREVAVEGSALLRNEDHLLPLSKEIKTVAVIGPSADLAQTGDYSAKPASDQLVTVLQGVKSHVSSTTKVLYARGCDYLSPDISGIAAAVAAAKQADAVILVVGDNSNESQGKATSGENNDGATLEIPGAQRQLIKEIQAAGKPVVLVLVNGKPFTLVWEANHIAAILETWYPGEEGGDAIADLVFGERNPSGRLPITFPRSSGQLPLRYNYLPTGRNYDYYDMPFSPLYRFGYGLSYTTFKYSNLAAAMNQDRGVAVVSAEVENTGDRDGDEVAQLYITDVHTSVITPVIELKGFSRVSLKKGEKKTVTFELTPYQLSLLNADMARVVEPGVFRVHVGGASPVPPSGGNDHKTKIGFKDPAQGVSGQFEIEKNYHADFVYDLKAPDQAAQGENFPVTVTVRNQGNLLDVASIELYGDKLLDTRRMEIEPGETHTCNFKVALSQSGRQTLAAILGKKAVFHEMTVSKAPAKSN